MFLQQKKSEFMEKYLRILDKKDEKIVYEQAQSIQRLAYQDINI